MSSSTMSKIASGCRYIAVVFNFFDCMFAGSRGELHRRSVEATCVPLRRVELEGTCSSTGEVATTAGGLRSWISPPEPAVAG